MKNTIFWFVPKNNRDENFCAFERRSYFIQLSSECLHLHPLLVYSVMREP